MKEKRWLGTWPAKCDLCGAQLQNTKYFIDGRDASGRWGLFCPLCHEAIGVGLGTGKGQKYRSSNRVKVEG